MSVSILQVFKSSTHTSGGSISQVCTGLTAGSRLLCWVTGSGVDTFDFADNVNGSWGAALDTVLAASGFLMAQATLASTAAGTVTVTVTFDFAPGADAAIWVAEVGGGTGLDGHNGVTQATPGSGANGLTASFSSTAGQTGMLIAWFTNSGNNDTVGTGFTLKLGDIDGFLEFKAVTSTSTQTVSATDTGGPTDTGAFGVFISGSAPAAASWYDDNTLCMAPQRVRATYAARSLTATQLPTDWLLPPMSAQNKKMMEWADPFRIHTPWRNRSEPKADNERYPADALQAVQNKKMFTWADPLRIPWANRTHTPSPWNQYEVVDALQALRNTKMFTWADPRGLPWSYRARTPPDLTPWSYPALTVAPPALQTFLDDFATRAPRPQVIWDSTPWLSVPLIPPLVLASFFQDDVPDLPPPVYRRTGEPPWAWSPRSTFGAFWQDDLPDLPPPVYRRAFESRPDGAVARPALADPWLPPPVRPFSTRPFTDAWFGAAKAAMASYFESELPRSLPLRYWPGGEPSWVLRVLATPTVLASFFQDDPRRPQAPVYQRAEEARPQGAVAVLALPDALLMLPPQTPVPRPFAELWAATRKTPVAGLFEDAPRSPWPPVYQRASEGPWVGLPKAATGPWFEEVPRQPQPTVYWRAGEGPWVATPKMATAPWFECEPTKKTVMPMTVVRPDSWQTPALGALRAWFIDQFQHPPRSVVRLQPVDNWGLKTPAAVVLTKALPDPFLPAAKWTVTRAIPEGWFGTRKTALSVFLDDPPRAPLVIVRRVSDSPILGLSRPWFEDSPRRPAAPAYARAGEPSWSASRRAAPWFEQPPPAAARAALAAARGEVLVLSAGRGALLDDSAPRPGRPSATSVAESLVLGASARGALLDPWVQRPSGIIVRAPASDAQPPRRSAVLLLPFFADDWQATRPHPWWPANIPILVHWFDGRVVVIPPLPLWASAWTGFSEFIAEALLLSETDAVSETDGRTNQESLIASETEAKKIDG